MIRAAKSPVEIRREAAQLARSWADDREATGDPEGAAEMRALASQITRIRLTRPWSEKLR
jgi:hypothetical protein